MLWFFHDALCPRGGFDCLSEQEFAKGSLYAVPQRDDSDDESGPQGGPGGPNESNVGPQTVPTRAKQVRGALGMHR